MKFTCAICILLASFTIHAQGVFQSIFHDEDGEKLRGTFITETPQGFLVIASHTNSGVPSDLVFAQTDLSGELLWTSKIEIDSSIYFDVYDAILTSNGGYMICGYYRPPPGDPQRAMVIRTGSMGEVQWIKTYADGDETRAMSIKERADGNYMILGRRTSLVDDDEEGFLLLELSPSGEVLSSASHTLLDINDFAGTVYATNDGYVVCGSVYTGESDGDVYVGRVSTDPSLNFQHYYRGPYTDSAKDIFQTSDGGFIVCGNRQQSTSGDATARRLFVMKINVYGEMQWARKYYGDYLAIESIPKRIKQTSDGGYIIEAHSSYNNAVLFKIDALGEVEWANKYGQSYDDVYLFDLIITSDGGYAATGRWEDDLYIFKTDAEGNSPCYQYPFDLTSTIADFTEYSGLGSVLSSYEVSNINALNKEFEPSGTVLCSYLDIQEKEDCNVDVYPNPWHDEMLTINTCRKFVGGKMQLTNALGEIVLCAPIADPLIRSDVIVPPGCYVLKLSTTENEVVVRHIIRS